MKQAHHSDYEGLRPPISKRDWTSAGESRDSLLRFLFETRPTVMSLLLSRLLHTDQSCNTPSSNFVSA